MNSETPLPKQSQMERMLQNVTALDTTDCVGYAMGTSVLTRCYAWLCATVSPVTRWACLLMVTNVLGKRLIRLLRILTIATLQPVS